MNTLCQYVVPGYHLCCSGSVCDTENRAQSSHSELHPNLFCLFYLRRRLARFLELGLDLLSSSSAVQGAEVKVELCHAPLSVVLDAFRSLLVAIS